MPNIRRLKMTADLADRLDPAAVDLAIWKCGTTACVIGHACQDAAHNAEGLRLRDFRRGEVPCYGASLVNWNAVESFYEIALADAYELFHLFAYSEWERNPHAVAERIRAFIAAHTLVPA